MSSAADRNLLFGILALQMDFIHREQLVAAMNAWILEKQTPLGRILVRQKVLGEEEQRLIDALVAKHLERHDGNAEKSLAAVGTGNSLRHALQQLGDADLRATLSQIGQVDDHLDPYHTLGASVGESTSDLRFRILRPHAKGGLGEVFVAEDEELRREVALKQIQVYHADNVESRNRFMLEAEITGGLEHPGIVPVYGFGTYADGRPFYAMRFIHGDSLQDAVERYHSPHGPHSDPTPRSLQLRQLLARFIDVCNAIEYAHSRGVLHRDLKPSNIMLGKYGETLVVDWGLAKPMDRAESFKSSLDERPLRPLTTSGSAPTRMGSAMGTPQYMSPEQAAGKLDRLGPQSDVYSLGATLYNLLTGKAPFADAAPGDLGEVLRRVQRGDFVRPRRVAPSVPKALEAICLKAMALEPSSRYDSPLPLANDLEHWLADEPVGAHAESWHERLYRFARRHRGATQAAAATLTAVAITAVVATLLIDSARKREAAARADSEVSFAAARMTVDDFLTRVSESKLLNVPGLQPLRRELLDEAARYYRGFIERRGQDPSVGLELSNTYYRLALIELETSAGPEALASLQRALTTANNLEAQGHDSTSQRELLANIYNAMGNVHQTANRLQPAQESFATAGKLRDALARETPDNPQLVRKQANSINNLATVEARLGKIAEAMQNFSKALQIRKQLVAQSPEKVQYLRDLAQGYYNQGIVLRDASQWSHATEALRNAAAAYHTLTEKEPKSIDNRRELASTLRVLGEVLGERGQNPEAAQLLQQSLQLAEKLARQNPFLPGLQADVAAIYVALGKFDRRESRLPPALEWFEKARAIQENLVASEADETRYATDLAGTLLEIGLVQLPTEDFATAHENFSRAVQLLTEQQSTQPESTSVLLALAQANADLGLVERGARNPAAAITHFQRELKLYERLAQTQAPRAEYLFGQADAYLNIAVEYRTQKKAEEARLATANANRLQRELLQICPDFPKYEQLAGEVLYLEGLLCFEQDKLQDALSFYEASCKLRRQLAASQPGNWEVQSALGVTLDELAVIHWQLEQDVEALARSHEASTLLRQAVEHAPAVLLFRRNLIGHLSNLTAMERSSGRVVEASGLVRERRALAGTDPAELYQVGAEWALLAASLLAGGPPPAQEARALVAQFQQEAIATLQAARDAGFQDVDRLRSDPRLANLRELPGFADLFPAPRSKP